MAAPKGNKFAGSRKGIPNKKTEQWEKFSEYMLSAGLSRFQTEIETLEGRDYVRAMIDLMEFFKPKLARSEHSGIDGKPIETRDVSDNMTKKELEEFIRSKLRRS